MAILRIAFFLLRDFLLSRSALAAENLALRQQVAVYKHTVKRPRLRPRDRIFWVLLSRLWANWRSALAIVQPETVIKWHLSLPKIRSALFCTHLCHLASGLLPTGLSIFTAWKDRKL